MKLVASNGTAETKLVMKMQLRHSIAKGYRKKGAIGHSIVGVGGCLTMEENIEGTCILTD